jgi:predicted aminopeptidase
LDLLNFLKCAILVGLLSGCQMGYLVKSAYNQMSLMNQRVPIEKALADPKISESDKAKIRLAQKAREFAENELHLKVTKNYTSFVKLDRPSVTYVVSAAPQWELKHHLFSYPFVGKMPYKGFFNPDDAKSFEQELKDKSLDTFRRGVSAYSTLGWFQDPLLSSMLTYSDHDLVNTIIHETVHTTLYIKQEADFNERLAVFLGNKGMELFYLKEEGPSSKTLALVRAENEDDRVFSKFITEELAQLARWYKDLPAESKTETNRQAQFQKIRDDFKTKIAPNLKSDSHKKFSEIELNNARLLVYKTYMQDLSDFEALYQLVGRSFEEFIKRCKDLENVKDPAAELKKIITDFKK